MEGNIKKAKNLREEFIEKIIRSVRGLTRKEAEIVLDTVTDLMRDSFRENRSIKFVGFRSKPFEFHPEDLGPILQSL